MKTRRTGLVFPDWTGFPRTGFQDWFFPVQLNWFLDRPGQKPRPVPVRQNQSSWTGFSQSSRTGFSQSSWTGFCIGQDRSPGQSQSAKNQSQSRTGFSQSRTGFSQSRTGFSGRPGEKPKPILGQGAAHWASLSLESSSKIGGPLHTADPRRGVLVLKFSLIALLSHRNPYFLRLRRIPLCIPLRKISKFQNSSASGGFPFVFP